ncbi:MAG: hypothetical protein ABI687_11995 [Flavitalea sp.]
MKTNLRAFAAMAIMLIILGSCGKKDISLSATDSTPETKPAIQTAVSTGINANCAGFYKALPFRYDSSSKKYSLILFIHGIGELGNGTSDLPNMLRAGLPRLINKKAFPPEFTVNGESHSFVVIAPQFKKWPSNADVNDVLRYARDHFRIDTNRIYVTGLSMGGGVTWEFSAEYGASIAAIAPICGGSWPDNTRAHNIASFNLPVWAFHNDDDGTVPVSYSRDYVSKINSWNPATPAIITTWPTGGHDAWTKAYSPDTRKNNKNIYEWMLGFQRRVTAK